MRKIVPILTCLLLLGACHKHQKPAPQVEDQGAPQVATMIDEPDLPTDRSDQITSIDAATGDGDGMPHDGGAAIPHGKVATATPHIAPDATQATDPAAGAVTAALPGAQ